VTDFTIAAAQIGVVRGDIAGNLARHAAAMTAAAASGVSVAVFPELSVSGYEPDLAAALAFEPDDSRLRPLRDHAVACGLTAVVGAPVRAAGKPFIGAFVLSASGAMSTYLKMHLGTTEGPFFVAGDAPLVVQSDGHSIGVAVCADTSRPSHPRTYVELGAGIYAAGVFFTAEWYPDDAPRFQRYAAQLGLLTVMANHGASTGTLTSAGKSAIWAPGGALLAQATGVEDTLVMATHTPAGWRGRLLPIAADASSMS
jgi:predicted amidohydrolase